MPGVAGDLHALGAACGREQESKQDLLEASWATLGRCGADRDPDLVKMGGVKAAMRLEEVCVWGRLLQKVWKCLWIWATVRASVNVGAVEVFC